MKKLWVTALGANQTLFQPRKSNIEPFQMFKNISRDTIGNFEEINEDTLNEEERVLPDLETAVNYLRPVLKIPLLEAKGQFSAKELFDVNRNVVERRSYGTCK